LSFRVSLVRLPLRSAFANSKGTTLARTALILQLEVRGVEAVSECVTDVVASSTGEDNGTSLKVIKGRFADLLREKVPQPLEFLNLVEGVEGRPMAKAAVEMLLWDHLGKLRGERLDKALGETRGYADAGIAIGLGSDRAVLSQARAAMRDGFKRIKLKVARNAAYERLKAVRDALPEARLSADANACFSIPRDVPELRRLDELHLDYIEQPLGFDDIFGHAKLAKEISTPICLDESVTTLARTEEILEREAASVINVKPGRVGGLSVAVEIARAARKAGAHVWVGGMLETGVGRAFNVALASQKLVDLPGDTSPNSRHFERDIVENPFKMEKGRVRPNPGAGAGVLLDRKYLERVTVRTWKVF